MQYNNPSSRPMYNGQNNTNGNSMPPDRRMYNNNPMYTNNNNNSAYPPSNYQKPGYPGQPSNYPNAPPSNHPGYNSQTKEEPEYFDPRDLPPRNPPGMLFDAPRNPNDVPEQDFNTHHDEYLSPEDRFIREVKEYNERLETRVERIDTVNPHNNMMSTRTVEIDPYEERKNVEEEFTLERILQKRVVKGGNVEYLQKWRAKAKTDKVYQGINENNSWEITWTDNIDGNYYKLANEFEKKCSIDKVEVIKTSGSRKRKLPEDDKFITEDFKAEEIVEKQTVKCELSQDNRKPLLKQIRRLWTFEEPSQDMAVPPVRTGGKGRPPNPLPAMVARTPASASAPLKQLDVDEEDLDLKDIDNFRTNLPALFNPNAPISGRAIMELMESKFGKPKSKPE